MPLSTSVPSRCFSTTNASAFPRRLSARLPSKRPAAVAPSAGSYTLWAAATTTNGLVVGSAPVTFSVREPLTHDTPAARVAGPVPSTPNDNKVNP